jgi:hypothetical protein
MEEARVCMTYAYIVSVSCIADTTIAEARKLEKPVYVIRCESTKMHLNVNISVYGTEDASIDVFICGVICIETLDT